MKNKILKVLTVVLLFIVIVGALKVNAARVVIDEDDNPNRIDVLSLYNNEYYVDIDDETQIGYLIHCIRGNEEVIGTCEIFVLDLNEETSYLLCSALDDSLGTVIITINGNEQIVTSVTGEISYVFYMGSSVIIND